MLGDCTARYGPFMPVTGKLHLGEARCLGVRRRFAPKLVGTRRTLSRDKIAHNWVGRE